MRATIKARVQHLIILILASVTLSYLLSIGTPSNALARTRPPVELGDPDGTGDQGAGPGLASKSFVVEATSTSPTGLDGFILMRRFESNSHSGLLFPHFLWRYAWRW
jgi:hypothetical protein